MAERRRVLGMKRSLLVAIPPVIAEQLGVTRGATVWWHLPWQGQAVLTATPVMASGYPDAQPLLAELTAARAEIARLRSRDDRRWRVRFGEGYALGSARMLMRLTPPRTGATEREDHRARMFDVYGAGPRRTRRPLQRVDLWTTRRPLDALEAPVVGASELAAFFEGQDRA